MASRKSRIVLTHWNAGVFRPASRSRILPELALYTLLYDEVLIRDEDFLTNPALTRLFAEPENLAVLSELLSEGLVKFLRLPEESYPEGRHFSARRFPLCARAEEHTLRRTYKGSQWSPSEEEWN